MGNRDYRNKEQKKPKKKDAKLEKIEKRAVEQTGLLKEPHRVSVPTATSEE